MATYISASIIGLAVIAVFVGIYYIVERSEDVTARLQTYAGTGLRPGREEGPSGWAGFLRRIDRLLSGQAVARRLALRLAQANLHLTVPEFVLLAVGATAAGGALGFAIQGEVISGVAGALVGLGLPWFVLERRRQKRINAFHDQLIDVLVLIVGSLRSGHALQNALDLASKEMGPPASEEFGRVLREIGFGVSQNEALNNLVERMETDDLQLIVTAVNISHEVGGNLSEVLEKITETLRERIRLQGEVRVLTTQQRLTSYLLTLLPVAMGVVLSLMNPQYMSGLFRPGVFRLIPVAAMLMAGIGFLLARRLSRIEV